MVWNAKLRFIIVTCHISANFLLKSSKTPQKKQLVTKHTVCSSHSEVLPSVLVASRIIIIIIVVVGGDGGESHYDVSKYH